MGKVGGSGQNLGREVYHEGLIWWSRTGATVVTAVVMLLAIVAVSLVDMLGSLADRWGSLDDRLEILVGRQGTELDTASLLVEGRKPFGLDA